MSTELFQLAQTKSPKQKWIEKHGLSTTPHGDAFICQAMNRLAPPSLWAIGGTADDAIVQWAIKNHIPLWNEEGIACAAAKIGTKRPTIDDERVIRFAAHQLALPVAKWASEEDDMDGVVRDLEKAIRYNNDGYEIAKDLDDLDDWSPDAALVEILDDCFSHKLRAREWLAKAWVIENGLTGPEIGSEVNFKRKPEAGVGIVNSNLEDGRSSVFFAQLGHVKEGVGTHGLIIEWEELTPVLATSPAVAHRL